MTDHAAPTVVGIDLSLTSTGIARIGPGGVSVHKIVSKGRADATLAQRHARLSLLRDRVALEVVDADLVVIEGPSLGQKSQSGVHDRSGLWWLVMDALFDERPGGAPGPQVVEVPPTNRAKYATGKGNASKDTVLAAVVRRYLDVDVTGNDEADALVLAAMGSRHLGFPIDTVPALNREGMAKVHWPEPAQLAA